MSVEEISAMPSVFSALATRGEYSYYRLADSAGEYGLAAIGDRGNVLELHLEITRWNHRVMRMLYDDLEWIKDLAKSLGKMGIVGAKQSLGNRVDHKWVRFTKAYGFKDHMVTQSAGLRVDR